MIFPDNYRENSLDPVAFTLGNHNALKNLGPIMEVFLFLQICLFVYYVFKQEKAEHFARMKLYQETLICIFMVIILYDAILAMISLNLNGLLSLGPQYYGSVLFGILLILFYLMYVIVWVRPFRLFELYKIQNCFRVIALGVLPLNKYGGIIVLDIVEVGFFIADMVLYRFEKLHMKIYVVEKLLTMIALNTSIFAT